MADGQHLAQSRYAEEISSASTAVRCTVKQSFRMPCLWAIGAFGAPGRGPSLDCTRHPWVKNPMRYDSGSGAWGYAAAPVLSISCSTDSSKSKSSKRIRVTVRLAARLQAGLLHPAQPSSLSFSVLGEVGEDLF